MNIVKTGNISLQGSHKVLRKGYVLHAGTHCNDGRPITESARYQEAVRLGIPIVLEPSKEERKGGRDDLWVDRYAPKTLADVIGHKESIAQLTQWLKVWPAQSRGALISGPPGIGKSTMAHLLAKAAGYTITEYNASDTRSISMLRGMFGLGMKRLQKEVVIMDEVDGFSAQDRGGVGELADLIRKSSCPIICIANQLPPKLAPLQKACLVVKCSRPVKSTIATAMLGLCKKEGVTISKAELETLCETGGNDIRSIVNQLQYGGTGVPPEQSSAASRQSRLHPPTDVSQTGNNNPGTTSSQKDATLRLDLFSATQKLMSNKRVSLHEADDFVYVDYGMVPLMVQEAYLAASRSLDEAVAASEQISFGDMMSTRQWKTQDWSLLPHVVHSTVATSRKVTGPCPFQIFPQLLGKNSKKMKHRRWMEDVARTRGRSASSMRLDEAESIRTILLRPLASLKGEKGDLPVIHDLIGRLDAIRLSRDQLLENVCETVFGDIDVPTKVKTMFTREYNKGHSMVKKVVKSIDDEVSEEEEEEEDDITDIYI
jgi:replication factor C subunit 1